MAGRKADHDRLARTLDARLRRTALRETPRAARAVLETIRQKMAAARLGRLGFALGSGGDRTVHERPGGGWSVSGHIHIRSQSARSVGAIVSYTEGANIRPRKGRWLWIPTDEAYRTVGLPAGSDTKKARLEPHLWDQTWGRKFGPLRVVKSVNGRPLLIIDNPVAVSLSGKLGLKKPLKSGRAPKGHVLKEFVVMFVAIPSTARAARLDPIELARQGQIALTSALSAGLA